MEDKQQKDIFQIIGDKTERIKQAEYILSQAVQEFDYTRRIHAMAGGEWYPEKDWVVEARKFLYQEDE